MAKIFYHNDIDGKVSAYWAYQHIKKSWLQKIDLIPIDYKDTFPIDSIDDNEIVWIVDFSVSPDTMKQLLEKSSEIIWIDHHKTAIEKYKDADSIKGIRRVGTAGCLLTYEYTTGKAIECAPLFTHHVDDYDTWKWKMRNTNEFILGLTIENTDPDSDLWEKLINEEKQELRLYNKILNQGLIIDKFLKNSGKAQLEEWTFSVTWQGYSCLVINSARITNLWKILQTTDLWKKGNFDIFIGFVFINGQWRIELRSKENEGIDVGEIAKQNGGGGHTHASGFLSKKMPF